MTDEPNNPYTDSRKLAKQYQLASRGIHAGCMYEGGGTRALIRDDETIEDYDPFWVLLPFLI